MNTARQRTTSRTKTISSGPPPWWATRRFALLLVGIVALLSYCNSFSVPFVFDDRVTIVDDDSIKDIGKIWQVFLSDSAGEIRPLVSLSFALNYFWGGLNVFSYHVVNLLIHILNGMFVYLIVGQLLKLSPLEESAISCSSPLIALLVALLFVSHPVQTEAVTYVWGRSDLLCAFFYLLTFLLFGKARSAREHIPETKKKKELSRRQVDKGRLYYYGAVSAFALGLGTKAVILSLPFLLVVFDYCFAARGENKHWWKNILKQHSPFFALAGVRLYLHYSFQKPDMIYALRDNLLWSERPDFVSNLLTQGYVLVHYLKLVMFPVGLNIDHDIPVVRPLLDGSALIGLGALVGLVGLAFFLRRRSVVASFGVVWFLLTLSFYFLFPLPDLLVERRLYLPSLGIFTCVVLLSQLLAQHLTVAWRSVRWAMLCRFSPIALVLLLGVMTIQRNRVWNDPHALWSEAAIKASTKARPHSNLAIISLEQKNFERAAAEAQRALLIDPGAAEAHYSLLDACISLGWWGPANAHFSQLLQTYPYYAVQWYSWRHQELGEKRSLFLRSFLLFEKELETAPGNADGHISLGFLYASLLGDKRKALAHFEEGTKFPSSRFRQRDMMRIVRDLRRRVGLQQDEQQAPAPASSMPR